MGNYRTQIPCPSFGLSISRGKECVIHYVMFHIWKREEGCWTTVCRLEIKAVRLRYCEMFPHILLMHCNSNIVTQPTVGYYYEEKFVLLFSYDLLPSICSSRCFIAVYPAPHLWTVLLRNFVCAGEKPIVPTAKPKGRCLATVLLNNVKVLRKNCHIAFIMKGFNPTPNPESKGTFFISCPQLEICAIKSYPCNRPWRPRHSSGG
jgi:hypothetical protein